MNPSVSSADAYTISSDAFASQDCRDASWYNFTNRYSPAVTYPDLAKDSRMVLFGIQKACDNIFKMRISHQDIKNFDKFMSRAHSFGGGLPFNLKMWKAVADIGYLPIAITHIPEGSTFFPNEPVVHVYNTLPGFGELAAQVEARLVGTVSVATACATLCRHWLERMREQVKIDMKKLYRTFTNDDVDLNARFQIHNFGSRACSAEETSILTGMAHLLSFNGTDNFDAAYEAWINGAQHPCGTSILALAHRNVQGYAQEEQAFQAISDATINDNVRIVSCVADCYNYNDAVDKIIELAKANEDVIYVVRPDSGDCFDTLITIFNKCVASNVYTECNGWKLPKNVRFIYGDSVKPVKQFEVMSKLRLSGMLPTQWGIWGVGGYIVNNSTRDSLSSAFKLCAMGNRMKSVLKLSESKSKLSIPGVNRISRPMLVTDRFVNNHFTVIPTGTLDIINPLPEYYYSAKHRQRENFDIVSKRAIDEFDSLSPFSNLYPTFGCNREHLHPSIVQMQDSFYRTYKE